MYMDNRLNRLPELFLHWAVKLVQGHRLNVAPNSVEVIVKAQYYDLQNSDLAWLRYKSQAIAKDRHLSDCSDGVLEDFMTSGWFKHCIAFATALNPVYKVIGSSVVLSRTARMMLVCLKIFNASALSALWLSPDSITASLPQDLQDKCSAPRSVIMDIVIGFISAVLSDGALIFLMFLHGRPPVLREMKTKQRFERSVLKKAQIKARLRILAFWTILLAYTSLSLYMNMAFLAGVSEKDGWAWCVATLWTILECVLLSPIKTAFFLGSAVTLLMMLRPSLKKDFRQRASFRFVQEGQPEFE